MLLLLGIVRKAKGLAPACTASVSKGDLPKSAAIAGETEMIRINDNDAVLVSASDSVGLSLQVMWMPLFVGVAFVAVEHVKLKSIQG